VPMPVITSFHAIRLMSETFEPTQSPDQFND